MFSRICTADEINALGVLDKATVVPAALGRAFGGELRMLRGWPILLMRGFVTIACSDRYLVVSEKPVRSGRTHDVNLRFPGEPSIKHGRVWVAVSL